MSQGVSGLLFAKGLVPESNAPSLSLTVAIGFYLRGLVEVGHC
jgi:hypothetical protein